MSIAVSTSRPIWLKPTEQAFRNGGLNAGSVAGGPTLLFDWERLGIDNTALRFVVVNTGAGDLTVLVEAGYGPSGPAEVGPAAPGSVVIHPGEAYGDPYGLDEMRPYWRVWISGTSSYEWGVMGIPR